MKKLTVLQTVSFTLLLLCFIAKVLAITSNYGVPEKSYIATTQNNYFSSSVLASSSVTATNYITTSAAIITTVYISETTQVTSLTTEVKYTTPGITTIPEITASDISVKEKFITIIKNEIGVAEAGYNNIKYNTWYYGRPVQDKTVSGSKYAWCTVFVSWCADQANIPTKIIPKTTNSRNMARYFNSLELYYSAKHYIPQVGDLIFFDHEKRRADISSIDHIGVVIAVNGNTVTTVEGNYSNRVSSNVYQLDDCLITGYATPDYGAT